ncbi:glutamate-rich WD repeat-containing protein 1-like [Oppia nitens]|uniref:glutamate-rich WD repeat-containing protein 1-like n=1 Tax=Oppia nitens TaxID=1686743 RepID=UPI0023DB1A83|nr:glutamate-rich WD repeat-containing protein 1-like [Oppia nitens]
MANEFQNEDIDSDGDSEGDSDSEMETIEGDGQQQLVRRTYIPKTINADEELDFDESAYIMYRKAQTEYPCLSFDVVEDTIGSGTERSDNYPLTCYLVAGTQSGKEEGNKILVLKMSNLNKIKQKDNEESDDEDSDDSDDEDEAQLDFIPIDHRGCVNRIRSTTINGKCLCGSWSESGTVYLWDFTQALNTVDDSLLINEYMKNKTTIKPIYSFNGHRVEGYGIDWSSLTPGFLATGDCRKNIFIWKPKEGGVWAVDQKPLPGHKESVEDIQWSPSEANVLASCSVDQSIRIWDIRAQHSTSCMLTVDKAHDSDVNVISWNKTEKTFIASGGDDGVIKIWDLRHFKSKSPKPIASFKHHLSHITSVEWHPTDGTVFAASGDDNQLTLWDLAVEKDNENETQEQELNQLPPQLLFIHQGQQEVKEIHWHKQIPGLIISTASNGIDLFTTISV